MVKSCKPNIMDSLHHHGSIGNYYAFGNKANYGMVNKSSVGVYSNKKSKNPIKQKEINNKADAIEISGINEINGAVDLFSIVLPNIKYMICPIIDSADELQNIISNANLKRAETACRGCWNVILSINAMTEQLHTENDCGYTVIKVPTQKLYCKLENIPEPVFIFHLNNKEQIALPLRTNTSFIYTGKFLTHRQHYRCNTDRSCEPFINWSSYSNEKLFNHLRKTFERLIETNSK